VPKSYEQGLVSESGHEPRYDLSLTEVEQLSAEFLKRHEIPGVPFGSYVISGQSPFANLGRFVETQVFEESFNNDSALMAEEYGPYDEASTFFVVMDHGTKMPIGTLRIMVNSSQGLKSLEDLPRTPLGITKEELCEAYEINPDRCVDASTLALMAPYRGPQSDLPRLLAYRPLYHTVISNPNFDHIVSIIDVQAQRSLWALRFPLHRVFDAPGFPYLDSKESYAMHAKTADFEPQMKFWIENFRASESNQRHQVAGWMEMLISDSSLLDTMVAYEDKHSTGQTFKLT
jgi:hypothetical protein